MKIVLVFVLGVLILIGAIALNTLASKFGLMSWYDFLKNPSTANWLSYVWLFFLYPLGLGIIAYAGFTVLK